MVEYNQAQVMERLSYWKDRLAEVDSAVAAGAQICSREYMSGERRLALNWIHRYKEIINADYSDVTSELIEYLPNKYKKKVKIELDEHTVDVVTQPSIFIHLDITNHAQRPYDL